MGDEKIVVPVDSSGAMLQIIAAAAQNPDIDVTKMQSLMDMKYREEDRQAERLFNDAMTQCQEAMPDIAATSYNSQTKSYFAKLEAIVNAITPIYTKHGFAVSFGTGESNIQDWLRTTMTLRHKGGHSVTEFYDLPIDNTGAKGTVNKTTTHGVASTRSYARRYLQVMAFNLSVGEDNDGNLDPITYINDQQIKELEALMKKAGKTEKQCLSHWSGQAKIELSSLSKIPDSIYESCTKLLERAITKNQEAQS